jgi:hypothetical protein
MKTTSISSIKKELQSMEVEDVLDICLRLIKFKKDNKELVHYLLFESNNEGGYIRQAKQDIDEAFAQTNSSSFYLAKKSIRRALRLTDKYIKLSGMPETELELLLFFCTCMQNTSINWKQSKVLLNIYQRVLARMEKSYALLHEDLQFEYRQSLDGLKVFSA